MASELDQKSLEQAFSSRPDIKGAIQAAAGMPTVTYFRRSSLCAVRPQLYEYCHESTIFMRLTVP